MVNRDDIAKQRERLDQLEKLEDVLDGLSEVLKTTVEAGHALPLEVQQAITARLAQYGLCVDRIKHEPRTDIVRLVKESK